MAKSKLFSRYQMDTDAEENGVWHDFGDGIKFKVRRLKSRKSQELRKELNKPHLNEIRREVLAEEVSKDLLVRQVAGGVIADWTGVENPDTGESMPYTPENAYTVLKALPELLDEIVGLSIDKDSFKAKDNEDAVKNS